jgi:hypothetical protein
MRSSRSSDSVKRFGRLSFVLLLVLVALVIAAPAAFAGSGAIEGTVTALGTPLINIAVVAYPADMPVTEAGDTHRPEPVLTGADGKYFINGLPDGVYNVKFFDPTRHPQQWATMWYDGIFSWATWAPPATATDVDVLANQVTSDINAEMTPTGYLSGVVHDWNGNALGGIQVWPYHDGLHMSWEAFVTAIETGRHRGGEMDAATDARPHLPDWSVDNMVYTDSAGQYAIGPLEPASSFPDNADIYPYGYKVYYHDPDKIWAPEWYDDNSPWMEGDLIQVDFTGAIDASGTPYSVDATLSASGSIGGWVDGDLGNGYEYDLEDVEVSVYYPLDLNFLDELGMSYGLLLGRDETDEYGNYFIDGLAPTPIGDMGYTVVFHPEAHHDRYYGQVFTDVEVHPTDTTELCALLEPVPHLDYVHPPFGVNDGPDRWASPVTVGGWGFHFIYGMEFVKQPITASSYVIPFTAPESIDFTGQAADLLLNLAAPLAPTGTYALVMTWDDPWSKDDGVEIMYNAYQVVDSYRAPQPVTPAPTIPVLPATPTPIAADPVVTPTPTPQPEQPVAGAITTVAPYKAVVKRGQKATLRFQVNEAVLGGTSAVKISIKNNKTGAVVKNIAKSVTMNSAASASFTCKLAKGVYTFTVTAGGSSASNTLTVK